MQGLMLLHPGAAVLACPSSFVGNDENLTSSGPKRCSAGGAEGELFGATRVQRRFGNQAYEISSEVAAVSGPIASLSWLEDAGWTF